MIDAFRRLLTRATPCAHRYNGWSVYRSRLGGWVQVRQCSQCQFVERRQVHLQHAGAGHG